jgi:hypothetical protein
MCPDFDLETMPGFFFFFHKRETSVIYRLYQNIPRGKKVGRHSSKSLEQKMPFKSILPSVLFFFVHWNTMAELPELTIVFLGNEANARDRATCMQYAVVQI